jgi:hypothetical protein
VIDLFSTPGDNGGNQQRRKVVPTRHRSTSVYPSPGTVEVLGGYHSKLLNRALECFAYQLSLAKARNEKVFKPKDWEYISLVLGSRKKEKRPAFDPHSERISIDLAAALREGHERLYLGGQVFGRGAEAKVEDLAERVGDLDYVRAWAAVWAAEQYLEEE